MKKFSSHCSSEPVNVLLTTRFSENVETSGGAAGRLTSLASFCSRTSRPSRIRHLLKASSSSHSGPSPCASRRLPKCCNASHECWTLRRPSAADEPLRKWPRADRTSRSLVSLQVWSSGHGESRERHDQVLMPSWRVDAESVRYSEQAQKKGRRTELEDQFFLRTIVFQICRQRCVERWCVKSIDQGESVPLGRVSR